VSYEPRIVAVLCALRTGARTSREVHAAIGDPTLNDTMNLIIGMDAMGLITTGPAGPHTVCLDKAGRYWLSQQGLS
jgi:hypothetical protein